MSIPTETPTQVAHPWKASVRTGIQILLSFIALYAVASAPINEFIEEFWPGSPVIAWVTGAGAFLAGVGILVTRLMALEQVNDFLTKLGLGATPKGDHAA